MKKKKILVFTDYFAPHWTGISKSISYFIEGLGDYYDIDVLTVKFDRSLKSREKIGKANVMREDYFISLNRSKYSFRILLRLFLIVKNFDSVIVNSPSSNILPVALITKLFKRKLIIFHQGDLILPKGILNRIIEAIFYVSTYLSLVFADIVSTYTRDYAINSKVIKPFLYKFKEMLIPVYLQKEADYKLLKFSNKGTRFTLGFAGRFAEEKGFDILFDAIAKVVDLEKNILFVFAGETNLGYENFYQKNLGKLKKIKKYVVNLGLLDSGKLQSFYSLMDFIIVPSRSDCFNLVQAEAMLTGTPVISSDIPGLRYMVRETGFGVLFKSQDPKDLCLKILTAIKGKNKILKNYHKVKEVLDNGKNIQKIKQVIG